MSLKQEQQMNALHQYIKKVSGSMIDSNISKPIVTGTITQLNGSYYTVQLMDSNQDNSIKAIALNANDTYQINEFVYLIKAAATLDSTYYIFGRVETVQENFLNLTLAEQFEEDLAFIVGKHFAVDTKEENSKMLLCTLTKTTHSAFFSQLLYKGVFKISSLITTTEVQNNYGLQIHFYKNDNCIYKCFFDTNSFLGQPALLKESLQEKVFLLNENTLKELSQSDNISIDIYGFGGKFRITNLQLSTGFLLDTKGILDAKLTVLNEKDYFSKDNLSQSVTLNTKVFSNGVEYSTNKIKYYWVIKDDSVRLETNSRYLSYAGKGWRCLNSFQTVSGISEEGSNLSLQLWDAKNSSIIFENENVFTNYMNIVKCIVKIEDILIESNEITIYNFNKESFSAYLECNGDASAQQGTLLAKTDELVLSAHIKNDNLKISSSDYTFGYSWYTKDLYAEIFPNENFSNIYIQDKYSTRADKDANHTYKVESENIEIFCEVSIFNKQGFLISIETTNSIQIISRASSADIQESLKYKYIITNTNQVTFKQKENENDLMILDFIGGQWEESSRYQWVEAKDYNALINQTLINNQYLFYTSQRVLSEVNLYTNTSKVLREDGWLTPRILKYKNSNGNEASYNFINQLNTLSQLTNGFTEQGIHTVENVYWPTNDTSAQSNKTYYIEISKDNYQPIDNPDFSSSTVYYEHYENKLFINAEMINTGTLTVSKEINGKTVTIFSTDIDEGTVEIAGFTVGQQGLSNGVANTSNNYVYVGTDGIKLGDTFSILYENNDWVVNTPGLKADKIEVTDTSGNTIFLADAQNHKVEVSQLDALSANMGTITAGKIQSANYSDDNFTPLIRRVKNIEEKRYISSLTLNRSKAQIEDKTTRFSYLNFECNLSDKNTLKETEKIRTPYCYHLEDIKNDHWAWNAELRDVTIMWVSGNAKISQETTLYTMFMGRSDGSESDLSKKITGTVTFWEDAGATERHFITSPYGLGWTLAYATIQERLKTQPSGPARRPNMDIYFGIEVYDNYASTLSEGGQINFVDPLLPKIYFPGITLSESGLGMYQGRVFLWNQDDTVVTFGKDIPGLLVETYDQDIDSYNAIKITPTKINFISKAASTPSDSTNSSSKIKRQIDKTYISFQDIATNGAEGEYYPRLEGTWQVSALTSPYLKTAYLYGTWDFSTASVITSDQNVKNSIQLQPEIYSQLFDKISPVIYKYNYGTSERYHTGLIAQDLEQAILDLGLTTQDFAAICYDIDEETGEKKNYGIRYEELVSMCIYEIQHNKARINELENKIKELKGEIL